VPSLLSSIRVILSPLANKLISAESPPEFLGSPLLLRALKVNVIAVICPA